MITLTREQKISNYRELIFLKKKKLTNLALEVQSLEKKLSKLEQQEKDSKGSFSQAASSLKG